MPKGEGNDGDKGRRAALIRWARERGEDVPPSRKNSPEGRVRSKYGKASDYNCALCYGRQARDWAYIHKTDREQVTSYFPLCRSCHHQYDGKSFGTIGNPFPWSETRRANYNRTIAARRAAKREGSGSNS